MNTYTDFVKSVESTSFHQPNIRLLHAAMGLITELAELIELVDEQHQLEELGDVAWYMALGFDALGASFEEAPVMEAEPFYAVVRGDDAGESMSIYAAELLDMLKKQIFYGREIDREKALHHLHMLKNCFHWGLSNMEPSMTIEQVVQANMKKLKARFPEKFTEEAANTRNVKEEYAAMNR